MFPFELLQNLRFEISKFMKEHTVKYLSSYKLSSGAVQLGEDSFADIHSRLLRVAVCCSGLSKVMGNLQVLV